MIPPDKITLIVPAFNEEANIQKGVLDKIGNFSQNNDLIECVIIADDGSTDSTAGIIETRYLPLYSKFKLIRLAHRGKARTVMSAIEATETPYLVFTDADLATPIEEVERLIDAANTHNSSIVIGSRGLVRPGAPFTRLILSAGMVVIRGLLTGLGSIKDTQCGFKLFATAAAKQIISKLLVFKKKEVGNQASVSAIFDVEFLFLAKLIGHKIIEVPVTWRHVETKRVSFWHDIVESLTDLARLKWHELKGDYK